MAESGSTPPPPSVGGAEPGFHGLGRESLDESQQGAPGRRITTGRPTAVGSEMLVFLYEFQHF